MNMKTEARKNAVFGLGGVLAVLCCVAGPAVLGAVGGAATGNVILGAVVAAVVAGLAWAGMRLLKGRSENLLTPSPGERWMWSSEPATLALPGCRDTW